MCGILGTVGYNEANIDGALCSISHRGPDWKGVYKNSPLSLGHTRLSIQDLSENGNQPMIDRTGRYVIIFNGEIYNHLDIREKLSGKYTFISSSDTETLLYGYIEYGKDILNILNGIFAFSIYDNEKEDLFIARDQLGVKPLYYYYKSNRLLFGSELKSFLFFDEFDRSINYSGLVNYLTFLWSPGEETAFKEVKKLLPGHFISVNVKKLESFKIHKYYEIPFLGRYSSAPENVLVDQLEKKLIEAVKRQLLSDVPVAFFLSGGLDSSAIVAIAKKLLPNQRLRCYTIKVLDKSNDGFSEDLMYARIVAKHLDLNLIEVEVKVDIVSDFDKMIYHLDEPQADPAALNVFNICKRAKKDGYKVLLGGTAGDDLFSGYRRHQALNYEKIFRIIPPWAGKFIKIISLQFNTNRLIFRRFRKLAINLDLSKIDRIYGYFEWFPLVKVKKLFSERVKPEILTYEPKELFHNLLKNIPNEKNDLNKVLYWEMRTFLVDHNLNYTDKLSMATGVEVRVPFLDLELLEFSTIIPPSLKMKGNTTKYILKKTMEKYLPHEVIYRPKVGFGAPVRDWIINDLENKINHDLSERAIMEQDIFDAQEIRELIMKNKSGKIDASYQIWGLLAIDSWLRQFTDKRY